MSDDEIDELQHMLRKLSAERQAVGEAMCWVTCVCVYEAMCWVTCVCVYEAMCWVTCVCVCEAMCWVTCVCVCVYARARSREAI